MRHEITESRKLRRRRRPTWRWRTQCGLTLMMGTAPTQHPERKPVTCMFCVAKEPHPDSREGKMRNLADVGADFLREQLKRPSFARAILP